MFSSNNQGELLEDFQYLVGYLNKQYPFFALIRREFWQKSPIRKDKDAPDETGDYLFEWSYLPRSTGKGFLVYIRIMPAFFNTSYRAEQQKDCETVRKPVNNFFAKYRQKPKLVDGDECRHHLSDDLISILMQEAREYENSEAKLLKNGLLSTTPTVFSRQSVKAGEGDAVPESKLKNIG